MCRMNSKLPLVEARHEGLVVSRHGQDVSVEDAQGHVHRCTWRRKVGLVVCGDRVAWHTTGRDEGVISAVAPRRNLLYRRDESGKEKAIAANVSQVVIVTTARPAHDADYRFNDRLIDRYTVAAEHIGAAVLLIVNKIDLLDAADLGRLDVDIAPLRAAGYRMAYTSVTTGHGLETLATDLRDHTSVFVGESGVGKSSLINWLLPESAIRVGDVSTGSGLGKHTTTAASLYHLPHGGDLIDSPGVREFGLSHIEREAVAMAFPEFRPYLGQCRFNDCRHANEPGCAIRAAVAAGDIAPRRYQSYVEITAS